MIKQLVLMAIIGIFISACSVNTANTPQPSQTIVSSDTSFTTGNLQVTVYDNSVNKIPNADVYLYLSYEDIKRNLHVLYLKTNNNGLANFGYINTGNYYLIATANLSAVLKTDTAVVQVQSRRVVYKNSILN